MNETQDPLYQIFESCLFQASNEDESYQELIDRVLEVYFEHMLTTCFIAERHFEDLRQEWHDEVQDMLRKKTYGYLNLRDYRQAQTRPLLTKSRRTS